MSSKDKKNENVNDNKGQISSLGNWLSLSKKDTKSEKTEETIKAEIAEYKTTPAKSLIVPFLSLADRAKGGRANRFFSYVSRDVDWEEAVKKNFSATPVPLQIWQDCSLESETWKEMYVRLYRFSDKLQKNIDEQSGVEIQPLNDPDAKKASRRIPSKLFMEVVKNGFDKFKEFYLNLGCPLSYPADINIEIEHYDSNGSKSPYTTYLLMAVANRHVAFVKQLLQRGANANATTFCLATYGTQGGDTALLIAAKNGDIECLQALLRHNYKKVQNPGDPPTISYQNHEGFTALHLAARGDHAACVAYLLAKDAPTNIKTRYAHNSNWYAQTPLECAKPNSQCYGLIKEKMEQRKEEIKEHTKQDTSEGCTIA